MVTLPRNSLHHTKAGFTLVELLTVVVILTLLAALLYPVFSSSRTQGHKTTDIANLKSLGLARSLYEQDNGPTVDTDILVSNRLVPLECLVSSLDPTPAGYANAFRTSERFPTRKYKDSYLDLSSAGSAYAAELVLSSPNPGWLVAFSESYDRISGSAPAYQDGVTPMLEGSSLRLMMDSSVAVRRAHLRHHYPSPQMQTFQNPLWFFTDNDDSVEPHG